MRHSHFCCLPETFQELGREQAEDSQVSATGALHWTTTFGSPLLFTAPATKVIFTLQAAPAPHEKYHHQLFNYWGTATDSQLQFNLAQDLKRKTILPEEKGN